MSEPSVPLAIRCFARSSEPAGGSRHQRAGSVGRRFVRPWSDGMSRRRRRLRRVTEEPSRGSRPTREYVMKFLISMHINPAVMDALADEEKAAIGAGHGRFIEELKQSGELITTQALDDPKQAAVVSLRAGQPVVTDGPFPEAKEYMGGFYLVDCEDKEVEQYKNNRIE